jgi:hypothetical protein
MGGRRMARTWTRAVVGLAMAVTASSLTVAVAPAAQAAAAVGPGEIVVDDVGGHVFVTTADTITVYDLDGKAVGSIADQYGARDLMLRGRTLYVIAGTVARINKVDADTLKVVGGWSVATTAYPRSMAWSNGKIWYSYGEQWSGGLASLDPVTGQVKGALAKNLYAGADVAATESPARVYTLDRGSSPSKINAYDITTDPPTFLRQSPHSNACSNGRELALSVDGTKAWTACGSPYHFNQSDVATLLEPAVQYPAKNYPNAVDRSADGHFLAGGISGTYSEDIFLYEVDKPVILKSFEIGGGGLVAGMLAIASDGSRVYAQSVDGALHTWLLGPVVTSVTPTSVVEGSGAPFSISGSGFSDVTSVKVGSVEAPFTVASDGILRVTTPAVAPGIHPLVLTSRWGKNVESSAARLTVTPKPPAAPAAPVISATGLRSVSLTWSAPAGSSGITSYKVKAYRDGSSTVDRLLSVTGTSTTVTGLASEASYRFTVAATNSGGTGPDSPKSASAKAGSPDIGPFTTLASFVSRQYLDVIGKAPSSAEVNGRREALATGTLTPAGYLTALRRGSDATTNVDPVTRLYRAAFLRIPDRGGLDHWVYAKRQGQSLTQISEVFARSSEFKARYGTLGNRAFVERLYVNVLGRPGDPGGINYWTGLLDSRKKTRGQIITGMSESNQYKLAQAAEVDTSVLYIAMLRRPPTADEFGAAVSALEGGSTVGALALEILTSPAYASRIAAL